MSKLYVGSADNLYGVNNFISLFLQTLLTFLRNGKHRSRAEGVAGMYTQGIDIFNEADGDHIAFAVADNFQFQLFPAQNRLLYQYLAYQAGLKTSGTYGFQLLFVVNQAAACTAHGIGRTKYNRVSQLVCNVQGLFNGVSHLTAGHFNAQFIHGFFKFYTVFSPLNGVYLNADYLYVVFVQNACLV